MCLGIPGQIVEVKDADSLVATVDILGVRRLVNIACVIGENETALDTLGAWVLVHVGFAMNRIDEREAELTLQVLREIGEAQAEAEALREGATS